jgi:hypothetical protein
MRDYRTAILGQKFGKLTVEQFLKINKWGQTVWLCRCECGKMTKGLISPLKSGNKKSCGCLDTIKGKERKSWQGYEDLSLTRFNKLKIDANKRKLEFAVSIEQLWKLFIRQNKKCALTGMDLSFGKGKWDTSASASLDRIDSSKGYTINNVQWIDKRVNFMKQQFSVEEFVLLCQKVAEHSGPLIQ